MAAIDDLVLGSVPDPGGANRLLIYVQNNKKSKSIRGSFRIVSDKNFQVSDLYGHQRNFMQREFETRIPAGSRAFVGFSKFFKHLDYHGTVEEEISITPSIIGGVYTGDEPLPQPRPETAYDYLFRYYDADSVEYFINLSFVYGVSFRAVHSNPPHSGTTSALDPFAQKALSVGYQGAAYDLHDVGFYTVAIMPFGGNPFQMS